MAEVQDLLPQAAIAEAVHPQVTAEAPRPAAQATAVPPRAGQVMEDHLQAALAADAPPAADSAAEAVMAADIPAADSAAAGTPAVASAAAAAANPRNTTNSSTPDNHQKI